MDRPKTDQRATTYFTPAELLDVRAAASLAGMSLSQFLRWAAIKTARGGDNG